MPICVDLEYKNNEPVVESTARRMVYDACNLVYKTPCPYILDIQTTPFWVLSNHPPSSSSAVSRTSLLVVFLSNLSSH